MNPMELIGTLQKANISLIYPKTPFKPLRPVSTEAGAGGGGGRVSRGRDRPKAGSYS